MKNKIQIMLLSLFFVIHTSNAYAVTDIMAKIQSVLEEVERYKKQAEQYTKQLLDAEKRARQGFDMAKGCLANPVGCATNMAMDYFTTGAIAGFPSISGSKGDILKEDADKMEDAVKNTEYKRGGSDSIEAVNKNRKENNAVVTDNIAILFAKAAVTKQAIYKEGEEIYTREFDNTMESILKAQGNVELSSNYRISRILELRAYMNSGQGVAGLTLHTQREGDEDEE